MFGFNPFSQGPFSALGGGGPVVTIELLSGVSTTATTGTVGVDASIRLTGAVATGSLATLTTVSSSTITISGSQASAALNTVSPAISSRLVGLQTSSSLGGLTPSVTTPQIVRIALVGNLAKTSQGGITPFGGIILGLDGVASSIAGSGVLGYQVSFSSELSGNVGVGGSGKFVVAIETGLNNGGGVAATVSAGDTTLPNIWQDINDDGVVSWDKISGDSSSVVWGGVESNQQVTWQDINDDNVPVNPENVWTGINSGSVYGPWTNVGTKQR